MLRHFLAALLLTPVVASAELDRCEQLILPGILGPVLVPHDVDADGFAAALARGTKLIARKDHALVKILRRELGAFTVVVSTVPRVREARANGGRLRGGSLAPAERAALGVDDGAATALFGATAADFETDGVDLLHGLREAARIAALGDAIADALKLSRDRFAPLAPLLAELAEPHAGEDDEDGLTQHTLENAWDKLEATHRDWIAAGPLDRARLPQTAGLGLHHLIEELLSTRGEPTPAIYRRASVHRGVLLVLRDSARRGRGLVDDRLNDLGSVLVLGPGNAVRSRDVHAILPLSAVDQRALSRLAKPARAVRGVQAAGRPRRF